MTACPSPTVVSLTILGMWLLAAACLTVGFLLGQNERRDRRRTTTET